MHLRALSIGVLVCTAALTRPAIAGDIALAESLFREGLKELDAGNYAVACPKLAESYAQDPGTGALFALATCQERSGKTATAWATYAEVAAQSRRDGRADREQAAQDRVKALEPLLSHLTIVVDPRVAETAGLVVMRDGSAVGRAAWGAAAPVDPGTHVIEATARGKRAWKLSVTVGDRADARTVHVPELGDESRTTPAAPSTVSTPAAGAKSSPLRPIGLVTGGVGIVSLGVGGFFGLRANSLDSQSKQNGHCDAANGCDAAGLAKRNDAVHAANLSTVFFVAGGVLTAAGATLFIVGGRGGESTTVQAAPAVGASSGGLVLQGRF